MPAPRRFLHAEYSTNPGPTNGDLVLTRYSVECARFPIRRHGSGATQRHNTREAIDQARAYARDNGYAGLIWSEGAPDLV